MDKAIAPRSRKPVSVACEPILWSLTSQIPGKRFLDARDRRPGTALLPSRECKPARRPRENAGYSSTLGKSWLASECVVGPGGLEPATRPLSAPAGKFRIRRAQTRHRRWSQKGLAFCCESSGSASTCVQGLKHILAFGRAVFIAESNIHHVPAFAERLYVIERGEIIFVGKPEQARRDPAVARVVEGTVPP